jgi:hypothetical protein
LAPRFLESARRNREPQMNTDFHGLQKPEINRLRFRVPSV